jgi:3-oxoacyl-[acyl-carrier protein] reductase
MADVFSLKDRRALVTGGSRGIGAAICELFAGNGARLAILHCEDDNNAGQLRAKLSGGGHDPLIINCDVAIEDEVDKAAKDVRQAMGGVDIIVNCAGIGGEKKFTKIEVAEWDRMINVHLRGTFLVTRAFFPDMLRQRWGRVINIASQVAYKGAPRLAHYCAAKAGIIGFTRALAYEGAPYKVMVNAIAPGPVETDLFRAASAEWRAMKLAQLPLGRFGEVEEIAPTALLLASEAGSFYCGQTLSPNGGDVML